MMIGCITDPFSSARDLFAGQRLLLPITR